MAGIKIRIHTVAGLRFMTATGTTRKVLVRMEKFTANCATHVWPNSNSLHEYMIKNHLANPSKLNVIGFGSSNGIDLRKYSPGSLDQAKIEEIKKQISYDERLVYLLSVGRVVKDKGIDELLTAFGSVYKDHTNTRLILLGSFEDELDPISDEARKILKEHPGIIHINWSDSVPYYMHLASMLIHPSYREGFPNVLLQAGAMNCPILCSRIEGNVDIVDDGETGIIFEVKDAASLEEKLRYALQHPDFLKHLAADLRKIIEQRFDQRFVHESLKNKYLELVNGQ